MSRLHELQNDIETLEYSKRRVLRRLAELEEMGLTHSPEFKALEEQIRVCNNNIRAIEAEMIRLEERRLEEAV